MPENYYVINSEINSARRDISHEDLTERQQRMRLKASPLRVDQLSKQKQYAKKKKEDKWKIMSPLERE